METSQQQPRFHDPAQETPNLVPTTSVEPANPTPIPYRRPKILVAGSSMNDMPRTRAAEERP